jgi:hypothetical protein
LTRACVAPIIGTEMSSPAPVQVGPEAGEALADTLADFTVEDHAESPRRRTHEAAVTPLNPEARARLRASLRKIG